MPIVGLLLGHAIGARFEAAASVLGGIVLFAVAAYIAKETMEQGYEAERLSFDSPGAAFAAGFGISMDELAIGFPMGTSGLPIPQTLVAIAVQAFIATYCGIIVGTRVGAALGRKTSRFAGLFAASAFALLAIYIGAEPFLKR